MDTFLKIGVFKHRVSRMILRTLGWVFRHRIGVVYYCLWTRLLPETRFAFLWTGRDI